LSQYWRKTIDRDRPLSLADWLRVAYQGGSSSVLVQALRIFHRLVKRCHDLIFQQNLESYDRAEKSEDDWEKQQFKINRKAIVWRQWYNTLNQLLSDFKARQREDVTVRPIYGDVSDPKDYLTSAGEWYLAVPAYSAAPESALDIVESLTSSDDEMQRLGLGIGLPTRAQFYASKSTYRSAMVSPYFGMDMVQLRELVTDPKRMIRRSRFSHYAAHSDVLSSHLLRVLSLPNSRDLTVQLERVIQSLLEGLPLVGSPETEDKRERPKTQAMSLGQ